jgi:hypothetical protein
MHARPVFPEGSGDSRAAIEGERRDCEIRKFFDAEIDTFNQLGQLGKALWKDGEKSRFAARLCARMR